VLFAGSMVAWPDSWLDEKGVLSGCNLRMKTAVEASND